MERPLAQLLAGLPGEPFGVWDGVTVTGVEMDARRVHPGCLFVAVPGSHVDGSAFVPEAVARGARALVLPPGRPPVPGIPGMHTSEPRRAVAALAGAFYGHPSRQLAVAGVTGSNGKTTVTGMTAQALTAAGIPTAYWTTDQVQCGRRFRPALTTPEACTLQQFLHEAVTGGMRAACIEVSSHAVVQHRVDGLHCTAGAITSVAPDHLDFHGSFAAYLAAKAQFLHDLPSSARCLYNQDDPWAVEAASGVRAGTLSFGFSPEADIRGLNPALTATAGRCRVRLSARAAEALGVQARAEMELGVPVTGSHNLQNALCALGLALALGAAPGDALRGLARFRPPARRLRILQAGGCTLIDDVAMNEASFDAVLGTVVQLQPPQTVVVVALRGHRGTDIQVRIAATLARWDRVLHFGPVIASLSRAALLPYGPAYQVQPAEEEAFRTAAVAAGLECHVCTELDAAVAAGVARLHPGGVLLLLGTFGMDDGLSLASTLLGGPPLPHHPLPDPG